MRPADAAHRAVAARHWVAAAWARLNSRARVLAFAIVLAIAGDAARPEVAAFQALVARRARRRAARLANLAQPKYLAPLARCRRD